MKYHSLIVPTAEWIKVFPSFMHPVVGRFASLPLKYYLAQFTTCAQPLVRQRIADMEHAQEDPTSKHGSPDDLLTFLIKDARTRGYLREDAERKICGDLIGAGFAAIYTTAITASSALLNLVTSPPKRAYMELIWSEVNEIAEKNKDPWTKSSLARMYRVDSALRESMRLSTFEAIVLTRLVRQDITLDNTFRLSRGTRIAIPGYCIHRDESLYPKADEYDAFRFLHREGGNLAHGVKHLVFSSVDRGGPKVSDENETDVPHFASKARIEKHLISKIAAQKGEKTRYTILRTVAFYENLTPNFLGRAFATFWQKQGSTPLYFISTTDIGVFAADAFTKPHEYEDKTISIGSQAMTFEQGSKIFKEVVGTDVPITFGFVGAMIKWLVTDLGKMFDWLKKTPCVIDEVDMKDRNPSMMDFRTWLKTQSGFRKS
jgi:hypothetical protein